MQRLEISGAVRRIYGSLGVWVVRRQTVKAFLSLERVNIMLFERGDIQLHVPDSINPIEFGSKLACFQISEKVVADC